MYSCQFCHKTFSFKTNLDAHVKTAKYCLKIRGEIPQNELICRYCNTTYTTPRNYEKHLSICKCKVVVEKYEKVIESIKLENTNLKNDLAEFNKNIDEWEKYCDNIEGQLENEKRKNIKLTRELDTRKGEINIYKKQKPQITNNNNTVIVNNIQKLKMVKKDNIEPIEVRARLLLDTYTYDLFLEGPNGFIKFLINCATLEVEGVNGDTITERNLVCTNISKGNFYMLEENKEKNLKVWVLDSHRKAINKVFDVIKDKIFDYYDILKDAFIRPPPRISLLELRDIRNKIEKEKKAEELEMKRCKSRGIEYKPTRPRTIDPEEEYINECQQINELNILNWGGEDGNEAHDNYMGKIRLCRPLIDGIRSEYTKDSDRYKFIDDISKETIKELSI